MVSLLMAKPGEENTITAVHGKIETRRFLEGMGFVEGTAITVISEYDGNLIVNVKDARVAINRAMASKIFI